MAKHIQSSTAMPAVAYYSSKSKKWLHEE